MKRYSILTALLLMASIVIGQGNVGIGTETPSALLHTYGIGTGEGNVLFQGQFKTTPGDPPITGSGTRMMWYPDKAAFRAGALPGGGGGFNWDKENIGNYSVALGYGTMAKGNYTFTVGNSSTALGSVSVAMGYGAYASGDYSLATGWSTTASGDYSTAMGDRTTAPSAYETVIGRFNTTYTPGSQTGWASTDRLFVIGNGTSNELRSNALTILKNGNLGIGTENPGYKLQVAGNATIGDASQIGIGLDFIGGELGLVDLGVDRLIAGKPDAYSDDLYQFGGTPGSAEGLIINTNHVGIGTVSPSEGFHLEDANFLATGTYGSSPALNVSGEGTRMFFYPGKSAFRAGRVTGAQWNDENMGDYSVAFGYNTLATGKYSTALGFSTSAPSGFETVIGIYNLEYTPTSAIGWAGNDRLFVIGNGNSDDTRSNALTILKSGKTGLGTTSPAERLHVDDANFLVTGIHSSSPVISTGASGEGTRMLFYPLKSAFRAGYVEGAQWDHNTIGEYSAAMGHSTVASGLYSFAGGIYAVAGGNYSVAMGLSAETVGYGSVAMGANTLVSGNYSTAFGEGSQVTSDHSVAIGYDNLAGGLRSVALGDRTTASGVVSVAMGSETEATGQYSTAMGFKAIANGNYSFAVNLNGDPGPVVPENTFQISGAINTIISEGNVGIGTATPGAKLHVDDGIFLTTGTFNSGPELPVSVAQTRMFFYPRKAAFRAGAATGAQWNDVNVGNYSTAMGYNSEASGAYSTAMGGSVKAQGDYSAAFGAASEATGNRSTAMGNTSKAIGLFSTAIGDRTIATGQASTAFGCQSRALGNYSFAIHLSNSIGPEVPANTFQISGATNTVISEGNMGIGTNAPTQKLDVNGQVRMRGGSPGTGKVLVSDADGVASWTDPAAETDPTWSGSANTTGDIGRTGSVGIGTATPTELLDVDGGDAMIHGHHIGRGGGALTTNLSLGYQALRDNVSGVFNTAIGYQALLNNEVDRNTAVGYQALFTNETGQRNTSSGHMALYTNQTGSYNTAFGTEALKLNLDGNSNTGVGNGALSEKTFGSGNTAVGENAGNGFAQVDNSTFIGKDAKTSSTLLSNVTVIGYNTTATASNQVRLGNSDITSFYCQGAYVGVVGITNRDVYVDNTGKIGYTSSSRRYKENISDMTDIDWLYELRPVNFNYISDELKKTQYGLIAEEVERINPGFVSYNAEGTPETVSYSSLISPLLKSVQEQHEMIIQLQQRITELEEKLKVGN
ncbi:MAG: tail fiber domain-containing protein [Bacteroidales bacterium]